MPTELRTELHPVYGDSLKEQQEQGVPTSSQVAPEGARRLLNKAWEDAGVLEDPEPVGNVRQYPISGPNGSVPIRIYTPDADGPFPVLMWMHGGGWIRGNLDTPDITCRKIANRVECSVVSVDYRLSPEHPFPTGLKDCYAVLEWIESNQDVVHGDETNLAVGGTSAGGNFAAALALMSRDLGGPEITLQIPDVPVLDYSFDRLSYEENASGFGLEAVDMRNYWDCYLDDEIDGLHPYASPLQARDLSDLPPAVVTTAGFDVLRDEGIAYVERLEDAGVPVEHLHYPNVPHASLASSWLANEVDPSMEALEDVCDCIRQAFN